MNDDVKEIIKSIIISILVIIVIILIVIVFSYNKVALGRVVPNVETYELDENIKQELESENEDETEIITTYILDAAELKYYERTKEYNKGKKHPFAEDQTNSASEDENNTPSDNRYYPDEGK